MLYSKYTSPLPGNLLAIHSPRLYPKPSESEPLAGPEICDT
jgi:hypothetical protein